MLQRAGHVVVEQLDLELSDHLVGGDCLVLAGDQDRAEEAGVFDRHLRAVLGLHRPQARPVVVQVRQAAVEVHVGDDEIEVVRARRDHVALGIADLAGQARDRADEVGPARVSPVRLHQAAVVHGAEYDQVGPGLGVFQTQLIEIEVEADREGHPPEVAVEDRRLPPAEDAVFGGLLDHDMVLIVGANDLTIPPDQDAGVAPGAVVHLSGGRIDDIAVILLGDLGEVVADLVLADAVVGQTFLSRKAARAVARLGHDDQVGLIRQHLREPPLPMGDHPFDDLLRLGVRIDRRRLGSERGDPHVPAFPGRNLLLGFLRQGRRRQKEGCGCDDEIETGLSHDVTPYR